MNILVINCSPQQTKSSSYTVVTTLIEQLSHGRDAQINQVDATKLAHIDSVYAQVLGSSGDLPAENTGTLTVSDSLIASLMAADAVVIASPMHNFTIPSSLKCWIDHVVRVGKTFEITETGKHPLLMDKPVYVVVSSGGIFSKEGAYQPDLFTPYMKTILASIGLTQVKFFTVEGTARGEAWVSEQIEAAKQAIYQSLTANIA